MNEKNTLTEKEFKPHTYACKKCGGHMKSTYSGEFVSCPCGDCAIDETLWYIRHIGGEREEVKDEI